MIRLMTISIEVHIVRTEFRILNTLLLTISYNRSERFQMPGNEIMRRPKVITLVCRYQI